MLLSLPKHGTTNKWRRCSVSVSEYKCQECGTSVVIDSTLLEDRYRELQAKLAAAEAERVTPETILAVAELHGTIYDLRQLLETAVDAMESNHDWQAHEFCKCGLRRHWYERAKQLTAEPSGNPGELPETIPVRFQEPTPMAPRTLQD